MAWLPTSNVPLQFFYNGVPASGYVLKFYEAGTSSNIAVSTSSAGTPTVSTVALNSDGFPEVSGNTVVIFVDQDYKVALYPSAAAASSDTGAVWTIDNIDLSDFAGLPALITAIANLTPNDGTFIVGDGTTWVAETGNTARTSLGLGTTNSPQFTNVTLTGTTTGAVLLGNASGGVTSLDVSLKGGLVVGDGTAAPQVLSVGPNGQVPIADSGEALGIRWGNQAAVTLPIVLRTSNTQMAQTDSGKYFKITSGTFTQTFAACATLGADWYMTYQNAGSGLVTIDPNGSETVDGLASFVMYPGETRIFQCDGTELRSIVLNSFDYTFTTSGTFTTPPGYRAIGGLVNAGGGGGSSSVGGGGGGALDFEKASSEFGSTETITVGAGGASGADGGNSSVGSLVTAYGGSGGAASTKGGNGGGALANGGPANTSYAGGSGDNGSVAATAGAYGGGGGAYTTDTTGASSMWGGGGGGATGGTSLYAGDGGGTGTNGTAPSGGGGTGTTTGARGEVRLWGVV